MVAHRDLPQGTARVTTGQLDGWFGRDSASGTEWVYGDPLPGGARGVVDRRPEVGGAAE